MEIYQNIISLVLLFRISNGAAILQTTYDLSTLQINSQNIEMAIDKAAKIVFALKSYAHYDRSGQKVRANLVEDLKSSIETLSQSVKAKHNAAYSLKNYTIFSVISMNLIKFGLISFITPFRQ